MPASVQTATVASLDDIAEAAAVRLQLLQLGERAGDVNRSSSEVDGHRPRVAADHSTDTVGVVSDAVVDGELLDHRLGFPLEGTARKVSPLGRW